MSGKKITKVTIAFENEDGQVRGWEFTDTPDVPLRQNISWACEPGPVQEVTVSVGGKAERLPKTGVIVPSGASFVVGENGPS